MMEQASEQAKGKAPRRTPEQLAAHHQRKANIARAKAKQAAKAALVKQQLELGQGALQAGLKTTADVAAAGVALQLLEAWFGPKGPVNVSGHMHFRALANLPRAGLVEDDFAPLTKWWDAQGFPAEEGDNGQ